MPASYLVVTRRHANVCRLCRHRHKRHSFAVTALERWYRQGVDVSNKLPHLATYMGHVSIASTHYYLRLSPELGQTASQRFHYYAGRIFANGGTT